MADQFCRSQLHEIQVIAETHRTTLFTISILHFLFSPVAIIGNALAITALWKTSSLPTNMRRLLLSLGFSDLAVGLLAQLMLGVAANITADEHGDNLDVLCPILYTSCRFLLYFLAFASFLNLITIAAERLLAISFHLRYNELVTSKRVIIVSVSIWIASCVPPAFAFVNFNLFVTVTMIFLSVGFPLTTFAYFRIYKAARYHQNQIHQQNSQATILFRERKSAFNVVYIYAVFAVCYLPHYCSVLSLMITDSSSDSLVVSLVTQFFVLLNSSLNPLVYFWRYREVRQSIKNILKKHCRTASE